MSSSKRPSFSRRACRACLIALPLLAAAFWTLQPAAQAALAALTYAPPVMASADWDLPERALELRRMLQRHFLHHHIYLPLEDIIIPAAAPGDSLAETMQKACGQSRLYVWIPFKFRLPVHGIKVIEWCWKPMVTEPQEPGANA